MSCTTERAILAGGLFLGRPKSVAPLIRASYSTRVAGYSGGDVRNAPTAITARMPKPLRSFSIRK